MLLIITNKTDLTSDYLILKLKKQNVPFFRFNTEDFLSKYDISIELSNSSKTAFITRYDKKTKVNLTEISGVYFRRPLSPKIEESIVQEEIEFAQRERLEALRSLWRMIDEKLWLNHPKYLLLANNKIDQLTKARWLGFTIPETLISSKASNIREFSSLHNKIVAKAVKHGFYKKEQYIKVALTKVLTSDEIKRLDDYAKVPLIVQEKIEKTYDVRVIVIDHNVFATAIHSQNHNKTKTDWRLWDLMSDIDLKHTRIELPSDVKKKCIDLTRLFNLNFSAIDLILSKNNQYYFLEMNPNGQWAWIEEKTGYPIRDTIINYFQETVKKRR